MGNCAVLYFTECVYRCIYVRFLFKIKFTLEQVYTFVAAFVAVEKMRNNRTEETGLCSVKAAGNKAEPAPILHFLISG